MRFAALDLSSKSGWAAWDGQSPNPVLGTKQLVGWQYDAGSMLELYRKWLGDFFAIHRPDMIAVENWYIPPHMDATTIGKQIQLAGFTQWACKAAKIECHMVTSASWRKSWFGHARGKTEDFKRRALHRCDELGWAYPDHNAAEAAGILDWLITQKARQMPPWRSHPLFIIGEGSCLPKS
jgi:Holliday junction resolvasome RuvABC endonuclease subunit